MKKVVDCLIVGGGISGILMALKLLSKGLTVKIIEKNNFLGGYFSGFESDGIRFDYCVSDYLGFEKDGALVRFLESLGMDNLLSMVSRISVVDQYIFPDAVYKLPAEWEKFSSSLKDIFPSESDSIDKFFLEIRALYDSISELQSGRVGLSPKLIKASGVTYEKFLNELFSDKKLKALLSARVFSSGVGLITMSAYLGKILFDGMYKIEGDLVAELVAKIKLLGGDIALNEEVVSIQSGTAEVCVITSKGERYFGKRIVSAADMKKTFEQLVGFGVKERDATEIAGRNVSLSSFSVHLLVNELPEKYRDDQGRRIYIFNDYEVFELYGARESGALKMDNGIKINVCSSRDSESAHQLRIEIDVNKKAFSESALCEKELAGALIKNVCDTLSLKPENVQIIKITNPVGFEKMTGTTDGAASGWCPNSRYKDVEVIEKSVEGDFYQTGCWDKFGSGILPIYLSADRITRTILKKNVLAASINCESL